MPPLSSRLTVSFGVLRGSFTGELEGLLSSHFVVKVSPDFTLTHRWSSYVAVRRR
jgi:hypothetical protein